MEEMRWVIKVKALKDGIYCGDAVEVWERDNRLDLTVVDGLGHGRQAAKAAEAILKWAGANLHLPLDELFAQCDNKVRHTRGAAWAVSRIIRGENELLYAGIGNIRTIVYRDKAKRLDGNPGIVGGGFRKLTIERLKLQRRDLVFMFSDGIKNIISVESFGAALYGDLRELTEKVFETQLRSHDDAALLIYRH